MAEKTSLLSPGSGEIALESGSGQPAGVPRVIWCSIALLAVTGCFGIYRDLAVLWMAWTTDPLRSIGMLIPPASVVLTLRVWRQYGWELRGTWWGLPVIALSFFLSLLRQNAVFVGSRRASGCNRLPGFTARLYLRQRGCSALRRHARLAQGMVSAWPAAAFSAGARLFQ